MAQITAELYVANCLPEGFGLAEHLTIIGATGLEVRACRVTAHEGSEDQEISSDADESNIAFFGIYARDSDGQLNCLHDMPDLEDGANLAVAQSEAVSHACRLIAHSGVGLPASVAAPF